MRNRFFTFLIACLLAVPAFASISAGMQWDVRTTGSDSNGGGFDSTVTSPGTDFSQQNTAQIAYTDLVIGATTTQATSAAHPFSSIYPGNVIDVASGTGCTTGRFEVLSVSGSTATLDRSLGTAASTCTANLGGSLANVSTATSAIGNSGNIIHVKAGTYTYTSATSWTPASSGNNFSVIGYGVAHLDGGTKPLITTATNSIDLVTVGSLQGLLFVSNLSFSNTAATRGRGIVNTSGLVPVGYFADCVFDGFTTAFPNPGQMFNPIVLVRCEIKNCTSSAIVQVHELYVYDSYVHDNTGSAINSSNAQTDNQVVLYGSIFASNANGFALANGNQDLRVDRCVFFNNTSGGINNISAGTPNALSVQNSIFYGNGWGININQAIGALQTALSRNNAFGANSSGDVHNYTKSASDVTLTATPFTNTASGNFSLNSTAGGGALLKGVGYPGIFPGGTTTGALDIGAAQSACAGGSSTGFACGFSKAARPAWAGAAR